MKAIVFYRHGGPEQLQLAEFPVPQIHDDEVLVRTRACALNHLDIWIRQGLPGVTIPLPHILGCETAGIVETVGKNVTGISRGQNVLIAPGLSCGHCSYCNDGWDSACPEFRIMGLQVHGGYAEFVKCPAQNILPVSDRWRLEEWAAVPLVFLTAWHMLVTRAGLKSGESVLIHAAGSGIGSAAIQIAKMLGSEVFTTVSSDDKTAFARSLGADHVINYSREDFASVIRAQTKGKGVDVVFEHIGPQTWEKSLASLAKLGRLVVCGGTSGPTVTLTLRPFFMQQLSIAGCYMGARRELHEVLKHMEAGRLKPVIDSLYPLSQALQAQQHMLDRKNLGKIVLTV